MAAKLARRAMVPGHDQHVGIQRSNLGKLLVKMLDHLYFGREIAVFARAIRVLVMEEKEVILMPQLAKRFDLIRQGGAGVGHFHADQPGQTTVHGIDRDGYRAEPVNLLHRVDFGITREPSQRYHIGGRLIVEKASSLGHKGIDGTSRDLGVGVGAFRQQWPVPRLLRIGVVDVVAQVMARASAKHGDKAMLADRLDEYLHVRNSHLLKKTTHRLAAFGGWSTGTTVGDQTGGVHRAEIPARRHIPRPDREVDAQRLQNPSPDAVAQRVVAEQRQVPWPAARGNAR